MKLFACLALGLGPLLSPQDPDPPALADIIIPTPLMIVQGEQSQLPAPDPLAIVGGTVHTMVPGEEPRIATLILRAGRIERLESGVEPPADCRVIDASGRHIVPGLVDAFCGYDPDHDALYTAAGVTTVRDWGNDPARVGYFRLPEVRDVVPGPRLLTPLIILEGSPPRDPGALGLSNPEEVQQLFDEVFFGPPHPGDPDRRPPPRPDYLHVDSTVTTEVWQALVAAAHARDLTVWGPRPTSLTLEQALAGGQDGLINLDSLLPSGEDWTGLDIPRCIELARPLAERGTPLVPMVQGLEAGLRVPDPEDPRLALLRPEAAAGWRLEGSARSNRMVRDPAGLEAGRRALALQMQLLRPLVAAGVNLVPGSGAGSTWLFPGDALHEELASWQAAGLSPVEILRAATAGAAAALGSAEEFGSLTPGLSADLLVLTEDPTLDVAALRSAELVVVRGRDLTRQRIDRTLEALASELRQGLGVAPPLAIVGGTVHTMIPGEEPRRATVLLRDGLIERIGPDLEVPPGVQVLDAEGLHVVPGLIDSLIGFDPDHDPLYVSAGVTTVRDWGDDPMRVAYFRQGELRELANGPRILTPITMLDGEPPSLASALTILGVADVQLFFEGVPEVGTELERRSPTRPDYVFIGPNLAPNVREAVFAEASARELPIWGMRPTGLELAPTLAQGMQGLVFLESLLPPGMDWERVLPLAFRVWAKQLVESDTALVPVLSALDVRLEIPDFERPELRYLRPRLLGIWAQEWRQREADMERDPAGVELAHRSLDKQKQALAALHEAGVKLLPGSSTGVPWCVPGAALHRELALWQDAGLPPADILWAATRGAAEGLGLAGELGSIGPGLRADLLVVAGDPSVDLAGLRSPRAVVLRGRLLERADLDEMLAALYRKVSIQVEMPVDVAPPVLPPEGLEVLAGQVEYRIAGRRLASERYAVVREPDGQVTYTARQVLHGPVGGEIRVLQATREGQLVGFSMSMVSGELDYAIRALPNNGVWTINRRVGDVDLPPLHTSPGEDPRVVDFMSVTTPLMLGQSLDAGPMPALLPGNPEVDPQVIGWTVRYDALGQHYIDTERGRLTCKMGRDGSLLYWNLPAGEQRIEVRPVWTQTYGGAGLPLPEVKKAKLPLPGEGVDEVDTDFLEDPAEEEAGAAEASAATGG